MTDDARNRVASGLRLAVDLMDAIGTDLAKFEAQVRAAVAEEIAVKIEAERTRLLDPIRAGLTTTAAKNAYSVAAKIARLAAGSSPDTTPERCGICGGHLTAGGCERHHDTTPEGRDA